MGEIFVAVVKVAGDSETINRALAMASDVIAQRSAPSATVELTAAAPVVALPAAAEQEAVKIFQCKHCIESFTSVGKLAAHTRAMHPKAPKGPKKSDLSAGAEMSGEFWCPQKNCGRSFHKRGWLNLHLEKEHGITV